MIRSYVIYIFFIISAITSHAQTPPEVKALIDSSRVYFYSDGEKTLQFSRAAYSLSDQINDYWGKLNALQMMGEGFFTLGKLDSATLMNEQAMALAEEENDDQEIANTYISLASVETAKGAYEDAILLYEKGIDKQSAIGDSSGMCDSWLRKGNVYSSQGNHAKAIASYLTSLRICEAVGNRQLIGYNYGSLGIIHDKRDAYHEAEKYYDRALEVFRSISDDYSVASILNNKGIMYKNMGNFEKGIDTYEESLSIFTRLGVERGRNACLSNLGILHNALGQHEIAAAFSQQGLEIARSLNNRSSEQDNLNALARSSLGLNDYPAALRFARESEKIAKELGSLESIRDVNETFYLIYQKVGQFENALEYFKHYIVFKDSVINLEQSRQINELKTIYETEKKDREIQILEKNAEIDRVKKTGLGIGLTLAVIAGILLIYQQWQKRRKDKQIFEQQHEIARQERKNAELENARLTSELAFKKKELTAKVLQLARKNAFLQNLHGQVNDIRRNAEGSTRDDVRRLERMINRDVDSESDWDDFLRAFREVHTDYIDALMNHFENLTQNDIKLACLMKMNMDTNQISQLLNITTDGVKKARYRLRKKMGLESGLNTQEFLLAFPGVKV